MSIPLPQSMDQEPVTWTLAHTTGKESLAGARGFVRFEPTAVAVAFPSMTILPRPVETRVRAGVMEPVDLMVNDPELWNWRVIPEVGVEWAPFNIDVPAEGVDLATAAVVPGKGPVRAVTGERGAQGASLESLEQIADDTLRGVIVDPLTGVAEVQDYVLPRGPEGPYGGTAVTDPQVASWIIDPTTSTREALASADIVGDRGEGLVTALDQRRDATVVVLGDSTGTPAHGEWPRRLGLALADKYPRTAVTYRLYSSTTSSYGEAEALSHGEHETDPVVFKDSFTRTAASLVGTVPDVGGEWTGDAAAYSVDGAAAVYTAVGNSAVYATASTAGRVATVAQMEVVYDGTANAAARVSLISARVSSSAFLWITFTPGSNLVEFKVSTPAGGTVVVGTATLADTGIIVSPGAQALSMSIEHEGNVVTFRCGAATYAHSLARADSDLFASASQVGMWGVILPHKVLEFSSTLVTESAPLPALNALTVYNGSVGSTRAEYPVPRVLAMIPTLPDVVVFNYGHNHATQTPAQFDAVLDGTVAAIRAVYPGVPCIVGGQNPQYPPTANPAAHQEREAHKREYARRRGFGYAPVLEAFMAQTDPRTYVKSDGVHPTNAGAGVWTAAVDRYLGSLSLAP